VPAVRDRVLAGTRAVRASADRIQASGRVTPAGLRLLDDALSRFEQVHQRWKRTHHSLAVRILGNATGTGYTEGASYLKAVVGNSLFRPADGDPS
jgi:tryptophan 2,3-dioxygenase